MILVFFIHIIHIIHIFYKFLLFSPLPKRTFAIFRDCAILYA